MCKNEVSLQANSNAVGGDEIEHYKLQWYLLSLLLSEFRLYYVSRN